MQEHEHAWHREGITPDVERTLGDLHRESVLTGFYLAGGTGLALQLGHRRSVDLDFFSRESFEPDALLEKIQQLNYSRVHLLKSLTYFDDAEKDPMPDVLVPLSWDEVKQFFASEAPGLL